MISGALQDPAQSIGMLATIQDPIVRAQAAMDVMHLVNERDDENALALLGELQRLAGQDPQLQAAMAEGIDMSRPTPPPAVPRVGRSRS